MKRIFAFATLTALLLGALSLTACHTKQSDGTEPPASEGLTYELNMQGDGYIVTGMGTCTDTRVVIPSTYEGLPVISIAKGAFQAAEPPVEEKPSEEKEKEKEKEQSKKASVDATPAFGMHLLSDAMALSAIKPLSIAQSLADTAPISDAVIADTSAEESPEAQITEIVIPDSVMDIGDAAFYGCEELSSFEVSNLINLIGTDAFKNTAYYLDEANWTGDALYLEEYLVEVRTTAKGDWTVREGTVNIANNAFEGCTEITSVSFPASLRFVGNMAFRGCTGITEVDLAIPGIQVGTNAFEDCTALTTVKIATDDVPNAPPVQSNIGMGTDRVDEVFMPGSMIDIAFDPTANPDLIYSSTIAYGAFQGCTALTTVTLGSNIGFIGGSAFEGCTALTVMDMSMITACSPETVVVTPGYNYRVPMCLQYVFTDCTSLKEVKLPKGIQWLNGTFRGCTALTEFTVPSTAKGLNGTFRGCTGLKSVTMPESVIALSDTFGGCSSLENAELPNTLQKIGRDTFSGCTSLLEISLPDSVTEIGESAFYNNESLIVSVGKGVKSIGKNGISYVRAITYRGTMAEWGKISLHESWGGEGGKEDGADIICADGTIVNGETFGESMQGILLSDGTVYGSYLGVTVKSYPDSRDEIVSLSLAEVEAELQKSGAEGWRRVDAIEIVKLDDGTNYMFYHRIKQMALYHVEKDTNQQGGNTSSEGTVMTGILLSDGTLYVQKNGVTLTVKDGKVKQSEVSFETMEATLKESGATDWSYLSVNQIRKQYGEEIYKMILSMTSKK